MSVKFPEEHEYFKKDKAISIKSDRLNKSGKKEPSPSMKSNSNNSTFFDHKIIEEITEDEFSITSDEIMHKN